MIISKESPLLGRLKNYVCIRNYELLVSALYFAVFMYIWKEATDFIDTN